MAAGAAKIGILGQRPGRSSQDWPAIEGEEEHFRFETVEPFLKGSGRGKRSRLATVSREAEPHLVRRMIEMGIGPLQRVLMVLPQAAALLDQNGMVQQANPALARLCGVSPKAWGEMPMEWLFTDESRRHFRGMLSQMRADGQPSEVQVQLRARRVIKQLTACWLSSSPETGLFVVLSEPEVEFEPMGPWRIQPVGASSAAPLAATPAATAPEPEPEPAQVSTSGVSQIPELLGAAVLLLEQDRDTRDGLCRMLEELGCNAYPVHDVDALVGLLERNEEPFDAVLVDPWRVPEGADRCLEQLGNARPELAILAYCTGNGQTAEPIWAPGVQAVLATPVSRYELSEALRSLIAAKADDPGTDTAEGETGVS